MIKIKEIRQGNVECVIDLESVYNHEELKKFDRRWDEFYVSDQANACVIKRNRYIKRPRLIDNER